MEKTLQEIALREFGIESLDRQDADDLDFHDIAVWTLKAALTAAFKAGQEASHTSRK